MRLRIIKGMYGMHRLIKISERQLRLVSDNIYPRGIMYSKEDKLLDAARAFAVKGRPLMALHEDNVRKLTPLEYFTVSQGFLAEHKVYDKLLDRFIDIRKRKNESKDCNE